VSLLFIYPNIWKWYKTLSYTIRLSVTIKEYKEVPLSLRGRTHSLKPHLIPGVQLEPIAPWQWRKSRKRPSWLKPGAVVFLRAGGSRKPCNPPFHHHPFPPAGHLTECPWCHFWGRERKRISSAAATAGPPSPILSLSVSCTRSEETLARVGSSSEI